MNSLNRIWLTWKKIICVALLLLAAGYIYGRPTLERWLNISLPAIAIGQEDIDGRSKPQNEPSFRMETGESLSKRNVGANLEVEDGFALKDIGNGLQQSPAGLVYGLGPNRESRIDHIMRHREDLADRPTHGVFDGSHDEVLALIDEAYRLIQKNSNQVNGQKSNRGGSNRMEYKIEMNRRIGYMGGRTGRQRDYPKSTTMMLILEEDRPVTAYPTW